METLQHKDAEGDEHIDAEPQNEVSGGEDASVTTDASGAPPAVVQAYRSPYNETVAPPGGPLSRVIRPPIDFPAESKRAQTIEDAEVDLEEDMEELKAAVHAYNVDFQARIVRLH